MSMNDEPLDGAWTWDELRDEVQGLRDEIARLRASLGDISHATDPEWMARKARRALAQNPRELAPEPENPNDFN